MESDFPEVGDGLFIDAAVASAYLETRH
jgi:hypothetical protein